jgi:hypothetical protein
LCGSCAGKACQSARRDAILNNKDTYLVIRPLDRTFSVAGDSDFQPVQIPLGIVIDIMGVNFHEDENEEEARVCFHYNGTSDEFTILLHSSDGLYRKIYLDTVTALPQVENVR